jgi:hypothetical protein
LIRLVISILFISAAPLQATDNGLVHLAQQTVTVPPPAPSTVPSILPQTQALGSCFMNCDTASGMCQGACSVSNSPTVTLAAPSAGVRPDPGALSQCYLNCTTQKLICKQACSIQVR